MSHELSRHLATFEQQSPYANGSEWIRNWSINLFVRLEEREGGNTVTVAFIHHQPSLQPIRHSLSTIAITHTLSLALSLSFSHVHCDIVKLPRIQ
jgi:hypothetical protein